MIFAMVEKFLHICEIQRKSSLKKHSAEKKMIGQGPQLLENLKNIPLKVRRQSHGATQYILISFLLLLLLTELLHTFRKKRQYVVLYYIRTIQGALGAKIYLLCTPKKVMVLIPGHHEETPAITIYPIQISQGRNEMR